jgi:hypothetical protein
VTFQHTGVSSPHWDDFNSEMPHMPHSTQVGGYQKYIKNKTNEREHFRSTQTKNIPGINIFNELGSVL